MTEIKEGAAANTDGLRDAFEMMASHSAERFEQIGALCQTLRLLLKSPSLYDDPLIALAQVEVILSISTEAANAIDAQAEQLGCARDATGARAVLTARASFVRSLQG